MEHAQPSQAQQRIQRRVPFNVSSAVVHRVRSKPGVYNSNLKRAKNIFLDKFNMYLPIQRVFFQANKVNA